MSVSPPTSIDHFELDCGLRMVHRSQSRSCALSATKMVSPRMIFRGSQPETRKIAFVQTLQLFDCHPNEIVQLFRRHAFAYGLCHLFQSWRQSTTYNLANYFCQFISKLESE